MYELIGNASFDEILNQAVVSFFFLQVVIKIILLLVYN